MIISVTLNPSLDYILQVEEIALKETQRAKRAMLFPGGKGLNVCRVLNRLDIKTDNWGFAGGPNGEKLLKLLKSEGNNVNFIKINKETRLNVIITELKNHQQLRISASGPEISSKELEEFYKQVHDIPDNIEFLSFGGSIPRNVPDCIYRDLISIAHDKGIKCILDTSKAPLIEGIKARPFMIKPNLHELKQIQHDENIESIEDIKKAASGLVEKGIKNVIVSLAEGGAVFVNESKIVHGLAPKVKVKSKVGAGDSMVAGLLYGLYKNLPELEVLKYGIATGTAAVLTAGTELAHPEDIPQILKNVEIKFSEDNKYI